MPAFVCTSITAGHASDMCISNSLNTASKQASPSVPYRYTYITIIDTSVFAFCVSDCVYSISLLRLLFHTGGFRIILSLTNFWHWIHQRCFVEQRKWGHYSISKWNDKFHSCSSTHDLNLGHAQLDDLIVCIFIALCSYSNWTTQVPIEGTIELARTEWSFSIKRYIFDWFNYLKYDICQSFWVSGMFKQLLMYFLLKF